MNFTYVCGKIKDAAVSLICGYSTTATDLLYTFAGRQVPSAWRARRARQAWRTRLALFTLFTLLSCWTLQSIKRKHYIDATLNIGKLIHNQRQRAPKKLRGSRVDRV